jgi:hypothetical protein
MILSSEMREAGQKAVDRARAIYILCAAFFEAALASHSAEPLGVEPVVERQPLCYQARHSATEPWFFTDKPGYWEWRPVYTAPPELAELQATITRLESEAIYAAAGFKAAQDEIERLKGGQGQAVAWQFYQDGKWWNGDDRIKDHRLNTERAGYKVRDVFAYQPAPVAVMLPEFETAFEA